MKSRLNRLVGILIAAAMLSSLLWMVPVAADVSFSDSFEKGDWQSGWTTLADKGSPVISTGKARTGSASVKINGTQVKRYAMNGNAKKVSVWLYDDTANQKATGLLKTSQGSGGIILGAYSEASQTNYVYRIGTATDSWDTTTVARSTGWHKLVIDATSGKKVRLYIDDKMVASTNEYVNFDGIELGDYWGQAATDVYMDDLEVSDEPEVVGAAGFSSGAALDFSDVDQNMAEPTRVLASLGILNGASDGAFNPEMKITRGDFLKSLNKLTANQSSAQLTEGDTEGTISFKQAVTLVMQALGYTSYAELNGSYPDGYIVAARRNGVLKGVDLEDWNAGISRIQAAQLLYNALWTKVMNIEGITSENAYITNQNTTAMEEFLDITTVDGVVHAVGKTGLTTDTGLENGWCRIGDVEYKVGSAWDIRNYIGHKVTGYIYHGDAGDLGLVQAVVDHNTKSLAVQAEDLNAEACTRTQLVYRDQNGKKRMAKLSSGLQMVYNGRYLFDWDLQDLTVSAGNVSLIDNDDDGVYDIAVVKAYQNMFINNINKTERKVFDKYVAGKMIDLSDDDVEVMITENGAALNFDELMTDTLITYMASKDYSFVEIIVSTSTVEGLVNRVFYEEDGKSVKEIFMNDRTYEAASNLKDADSVIQPNDTVTLYLDAEGKIGAFTAAEDNTYQYGYVVAAEADGSPLSAVTKVKIFDESGELNVYDTNEVFRLNAEKKNAQDLVKNQTFPTLQLVKFKLAKDDTIRELITADESYQGKDDLKTDGDAFWLYEKKNVRYYIGPGFRDQGGTILPASTTKVFYVPNKEPNSPDNENLFEIKTNVGYSDNVMYDYEAYNVSKFNVPEIMVIKVENKEPSATDAKTRPFQIFVSMVETVDDEGNRVKAVEYWESGRVQQKNIKDGLDLFGDNVPNKFDTIRTYTDKKGEIVGTIAESAPRTTLQNISLGNDARALLRVKVGEVSDKNMIVFDNEGFTYVLNLPSDRVYVIGNDSVRAGQKSDLGYGDEVLLRIYDGSVKEAIVYQK